MEECENAFCELKTLLGKVPLLSKPKHRETLLIYFTVYEKEVSSILIARKDRYSSSMYYVNNALQDTETSQFYISYKLRPSVKGHALAGFMAEFANIPKGLLKAKPHELPIWKLYVHRSSGEAGARARILLISFDRHNLNCVLPRVQGFEQCFQIRGTPSMLEVGKRDKRKQSLDLQ
ncbi:Retrovirus-related Pol polyprotein from transposon [Abeliophyllum distichum]|uniref:Retrovirus-related Pol polyprotein from transposon n=1 Tax=Abeliophyllum distichum TaxID=126358 RepID=A0ABD1UPE0_9LAMI